MSPLIPTPEQDSPAPEAHAPSSPAQPAARLRRVLACVSCQQRKVKCDRRFPCANCTRAGTQCLPATLVPRQRRRRFPERELLERLRHYESLLRQHSIEFEPLHSSSAVKQSPSVDGKSSGSPSMTLSGDRATGEEGLARQKSPGKSDAGYKTKDFWHIMNQKSRNSHVDSDDDSEDDNADSDSSSDGVAQSAIRKAWDTLSETDDQLLFGSRRPDVDLSTLHPGQIQIFRLWQIYLENVDPLLKVTHSPSLQGRIIDAAGDVGSISPKLEALMFAIYCVSILSLSDDECRTIFKVARQDLLVSYQFGCRQALLNCSALRSSDRDSLTAFHLYLIARRPDMDPRTLSSMLAVVIRIAQRIGLHNESTPNKCTALEAEMRRRLWWSIVAFDARIAEMSDYRTTVLAPTWDCRTPWDVSDLELRPETTKIPPAVHGRSTEAVFAVVRSELYDFVRHCSFHLDFLNPVLKAVAKDVQHGPMPEGGELVNLGNMIEEKYLRFCNPQNPLHHMTIWTARAYLAKNRLMEYYARHSASSVPPTDTQLDAAAIHALDMMECDTKLMISPLTKGYMWFMQFQYPFVAYIHMLQDLKKRPLRHHADKLWKAMSDNYNLRVKGNKLNGNPFFEILSGVVLSAWVAREAVSGDLQDLAVPRIVSHIREYMMLTKPDLRVGNAGNSQDVNNINIDDLSIPFSMDFGNPGPLAGVVEQVSTGLTPWSFPVMPEQAPIETTEQQLDQNMRPWGGMNGFGW